MSKIKFKEAADLNEILGACGTKGLAINSVISILDIKKTVETVAKKYENVFETIMRDYNVPNENGSYTWKGFENEAEITKKVTDLLEHEEDVKPINVIPIEDVIKMSEGHSINIVSFLTRLLVKNEEEGQ